MQLMLLSLHSTTPNNAWKHKYKCLQMYQIQTHFPTLVDFLESCTGSLVVYGDFLEAYVKLLEPDTNFLCVRHLFSTSIYCAMYLTAETT